METKTIQKGSMLIARPTMLSDVFSRSVVILTDHSDQTGSIGFVLNKSMNLPVADFISDLNADFQVYEGGPVDQENIYYLHCRPDLISDCEHIKGNLYWSGKYEDVRHAINNGFITDKEIRFYLGYSGWADNQLKSEIDRKAWTVIEDKNLNIFDEWSIDLWKSQMKRLGGENLLWVNMPENPMFN